MHERLMPNKRLAVLLAAIALVLCAFAAPFSQTAFAEQPVYKSWEDFAGKKVAMLAGAPFEDAVRAKSPDVGEVTYFSSMPDMLLALRSGKIDAAVANSAVGTLADNRNPDLILFPEPLTINDMGIAFKKGSSWHEPFNKVISGFVEDGTIDELWDKWTSDDDSQKTLPEQSWPGANGTVRIAACSTLEPCCYMGENGPTGLEIEILLRAAEQLDVRLEFTPMEFSEILASIEAGKADAGCGSILITPERSAVMDFAPTHANNLVLLVRSDGASAGGSPSIASIDQLAGKKIAYINGSVYDAAVEQRVEGTKAEWFSSFADCLAAVTSGKADAAVQLSPICELAVLRSEGELALVPERVEDVDEAYFFPHGSPLVEEFNALIDRFEADGTLKQLEEKWVRGDESAKTLPEQDWDAPKGTMHFATSGVIEPLSYPGPKGVAYGYDVELAMLIARELGYKLKITMVPMDSIFAEVSSGKADFGGALTVTPERAEVVDFSKSIMDIGVSVVVRNESAQHESFFHGLGQSFERTFITENRWQLILSGLGITLLIALCSGAIGTFLGFLTVLARRHGGQKADALIGGFQMLIGRLPIVVVLMVFYYIIFGWIDISGTFVAIVVFSLAFGAASGNIMWNSVSAISRGQEEASLALGFNENESFFNVVLPQAARQFIPLLQAQFVSLIKDTAVVGYIAVIDLTRAGDLIRSRTMEAFFPLFATALVYFAICTLVVALMNRVMKRLDVSKRERSIEGVTL